MKALSAAKKLGELVEAPLDASNCKEVWAVAQTTLQEAIFISLVTDAELAQAQRVQKVENWMSKIQKLGKSYGIELTERMHKSIIKKAGELIGSG